MVADSEDFGGDDPTGKLIPFPRMRENEKLAEAWARAVEVSNHKKKSRHRLISPSDVVQSMLDMRKMPKMPWPEEWPQLGIRCRTYVGECVGFVGSIGGGKCLAPGTPVLRFDGSVCRADEVQVGDLLMGPDSLARRVASLATGEDEMYRIVPVKGDAWECNSVHILTLVETVSGSVIDISLDEFLKWPKSKRNRYKLFFTGVDFPAGKPLPVDPWFFGLWCGDGGKDSKSVTITTMDDEVVDGIREVAARWGLELKCYRQDGQANTYGITGDRGGSPGSNGLLNAIRSIWPGDRLPREYLTASRGNRLSFLAGLLDSDGHLKESGTTFEFTSCKQGWADDVAFLCRSLGFRATVSHKNGTGSYSERTYWRVHISGGTSAIPTRVARKKAPASRQIKNVLRTGFSVERIGRGRYSGWTLDGDGRFLLGDFTVTHNTQKGMQLARAVMGSGMPALWANLELGVEQGVARLLGNMNGEHAMTVLDDWGEGMLRHQVAAVADMFHFVDRYDAVDEQLQAMRDAIEIALQVYRVPPLLVVDHIGMLITDAKDLRAEMLRVGKQFEKMALETKAWILILAQGTKAGQQLLTGRVEVESAADAIGAAAESQILQQVCSNVIVSQLYKEDDAEVLEGRDLVAKARWTGKEGQVGTRYKKRGGVWEELDYLPPTPQQVEAEATAQKKDTHRTERPQSKPEIRQALNVSAAGDAAAMRRAAVLRAITEAGMYGLEQHLMRNVRGAGRGGQLSRDLQELERQGAIERAVGGRWRAVLR